MKTTLTGSGSLFEKERRACVGWPFMSLMPKISEDGKDADTVTAIWGAELLSSISSTSSI